MLLHELFFRTYSLGRQGISLFSQFVSVFQIFKLLVPRNRNLEKKIAHPPGAATTVAGRFFRRPAATVGQKKVQFWKKMAMNMRQETKHPNKKG